MSYVQLSGFPEISETTDSLKSVVEATGHVTEDIAQSGKNVVVTFADANAAEDVAAQLDGLFYDADHSLKAVVCSKPKPKHPMLRPQPNPQGAPNGSKTGAAVNSWERNAGSTPGAVKNSWGSNPAYNHGRRKSRSRSPRGGGDKSRGWDLDEDDLNFQVELINLPDAYTHESLQELHTYLELPLRTFESTRFGSRHSGAILRYANEASARAAAEAFHGQEVMEVGGGMCTLEARVRASSGPAKVYPSVYVSDIPIGFTEDQLRELHAKEGLDARTCLGAKILNSKNPRSGTTCCIARYTDQEAAERAISGLRGKPVVTQSGVVKFLGMRMAKPAGWMVKTGKADEQHKAYKDGKRSAAKNKPFKHRLDRFSDAFCLDRPTVVWLSRLPLEVQSQIYEEFDSRANDPSLKDREEMAAQLRLFAESVHPESANDAPAIGPGPWEDLSEDNPMRGFAERWRLSKGDIKWFSALTKDVQEHAMRNFDPEQAEVRDTNTGGILRRFVSTGVHGVDEKQTSSMEEDAKGRKAIRLSDDLLDRLIADGGHRIRSTTKEIKKKTGCNIEIARKHESVNGEREVILHGTPEACDAAHAMIEELVESRLDSGDFEQGAGRQAKHFTPDVLHFGKRCGLSLDHLEWFTKYPEGVQWKVMNDFCPKNGDPDGTVGLFRKMTKGVCAEYERRGGGKGKGAEKGWDKGFGKGWDKGFDKGWGHKGFDKGFGKGYGQVPPPGWGPPPPGWGPPPLPPPGWAMPPPGMGGKGNFGLAPLPPPGWGPPPLPPDNEEAGNDDDDPWSFGPSKPAPRAARGGPPRGPPQREPPREGPLQLQPTAKSAPPNAPRWPGQGGSRLPPGEFEAEGVYEDAEATWETSQEEFDGDAKQEEEEAPWGEEGQEDYGAQGEDYSRLPPGEFEAEGVAYAQDSDSVEEEYVEEDMRYDQVEEAEQEAWQPARQATTSSVRRRGRPYG